MNGPRLTTYWHGPWPATACPGCSGCAIRRQLDERESFSRAEVAHLLALAFRSGASLAHEMAEDIARWAQEPPVRRSAQKAYEARREALDEGAARQKAWDAEHAASGTLDGVEWPEVAAIGGGGTT